MFGLPGSFYDPRIHEHSHRHRADQHARGHRQRRHVALSVLHDSKPLPTSPGLPRGEASTVLDDNRSVDEHDAAR